MAYRSLSADEVAQLRSETRQPGVYAGVLKEFAESGDAGADVSDSFGGRKLRSASAALKRAISKSDQYNGIDVVYVNKDGNETLALVRQS